MAKKNALPHRWLKCGRECWVEDDQLVIKDWYKEHPSYVREAEARMTLEDMNQNSKARRRVTTEMLHQWRKGRLDDDGEDGPFDTYHCPTNGARRYSRGEVRQAESGAGMGIAQAKGDRPSSISVELKDGGSYSHRFLCLPDTIDPREDKGSRPGARRGS
jgi:hypothetical protein